MARRPPGHVRRKVDANHHEVKDGLEAEGFLVQSIAGVGLGVPDLLVWGGRFVVFEVKPPKKRNHLSEAEVKWIAKWSAAGAEVYVVCSAPEAIAKMRATAKAERAVDPRQADLLNPETLLRRTQARIADQMKTRFRRLER